MHILEYSIIALTLLTLSTGNEFKDGNENIVPATCQLSWRSLHSGFHRDVLSNVTITFGEKLPTELTDCEVLLKQHLPTGLYVDLYQMENLRQFGGPRVFSAVDIDLELPEYLAETYTIYIYNPLSKLKDTDSLQANISLPIHLRYQRPSATHEFAQTILQAPDVFFLCRLSADWVERLSQTDAVTAPCSDNTSADCAWIPLTCPGAQDLTFEVPVANLNYRTFIVVTTLFVTLAGTAVLVYFIIQYPRPDDTEKKES